MTNRRLIIRRSVGLVPILVALGVGYFSLRGASSRKPSPDPPGMKWIPGGQFLMGTDSTDAWPEERPAHPVKVEGFWIDEAEVTVEQFRRFIEETHYVTTAELPPNLPSSDRPRTIPPGSLVFTPTARPVPLDDFSAWWAWTPGASWKHPEGPGSDIEGREDHPVVQVSWDDANAYANWAGKRLPTEAEWEMAARGGLRSKPFVWGEAEPGADGRWQANLWQGQFPYRNAKADGFERTSPVKSFPANGFGLFDMAGNVWEWCEDRFDPGRDASERVQRGGSFLCNGDYCSRYRPESRIGCSPDTGASHIGFRCARSASLAEAPPKR